MYEKIDRGEKSASCKVQLKLGNKNKWVWYKIDYAIIFDRDQKPIRAIGCASNITQQVEAKHKYQELVALQELTEQKSVGSFTINISKNEVMNCRSQAPEFLAFSNMTVDGFFSASRGLVIGEKSKEVYDSLFLRDKLFQMFSQGIREKSVEVFYSLGGGRERWLKMFITLTKNPTTGDLIGFTYAVDITRERLWTDMTNAVGSSYFDFMICINVHTQEFLTYIPTEKAVTLNSDYDKRIGAEIQNEVKQFVGLKHEDIYQKFKLSNIIEALEQKSEYRFVFTCTDVNGKMYCKGHTCTYVSEEKNFITLVRNDFYDIYVAEQKKNRELKETLKLAEHANSAKTDFLSAMSHDMRTPMNAIIGMSYLGIESMNLEESREYHKKVNISGKYLLGLINDTLDMSKIDSDKMVLNPEPYFFSEFISSIFTLFKNRAEEKNITFAISENRSAGFAILIDKMRLQQIFVNLINNAIKFTHSGGRVEFFMEA
ncbi:MAG: histidine kinase dimerization/phospho-acceptor domain-containing protein, partial [Oscillospiraceae bacterium]